MQTTGDIHNHTSPPPPPLTLKVTVDLQGIKLNQTKHCQFNYIFQNKLFKNLEMRASYPQKRVFK